MVQEQALIGQYGQASGRPAARQPAVSRVGYRLAAKRNGCGLARRGKRHRGWFRAGLGNHSGLGLTSRLRRTGGALVVIAGRPVRAGAP